MMFSTMPLKQQLAILRQWCGDIYWREAILCVPAIIVVLAFSSLLNPIMAVVMISTAFSVGLGASHTLCSMRWGAMIVAVAGMALAAFAGSLLGFYPSVVIVITALLAAACAAIASYDNNWWWVMLQIIIAFLVASYFPNHLEHAALRTVFVLLGGALQIGCTVLLARLIPNIAAPLPTTNPLAGNLSLRFVCAGAIAVALALYTAQSISLKNDYWAPMSALLILRPTSQDSLKRGINRLTGTVIGCCIATLIIYLFHDNFVILLISLVITVGLAFAMQRAHYGVYSGTVAATIVFLIAVGHGDPIATTEHRLIATLIGGAIAIIVGRVLRV
ncbi:FUSC family protein [Testudinibacter aquarius]|uniref:Integral membrane bound transporter domain-containing protein n=2 Tax=Testudinibacter aquarius TaxID=1524974 RepID=A0ABY2XRZ6_9PAST|nr:FUSC family protein [Testudinibacter aquarius]TNG88480.1 hypothetical protein FHQ21_11210 [Testudinibacter aquarius]